VARSEANLRGCERRRAAQSSCRARLLRESGTARRVALSKPGSGRAASKPCGGSWRSSGPPSGGAGGQRRGRGTFGCSGCDGVVGFPSGSNRRRGHGSVFGPGQRTKDHPAPQGAGDRESAAVFGLRAEPVGGRLCLRAEVIRIGPRSQTKPRNFAFPGLSGPGNAPRIQGSAARAGGDLTPPTQYAWQAGTCSIQSPWEHRLGRGGNAAARERTPRWSKALRSQSGSSWRHGGRDERREGNAFR
jgi:hypothetical protein